MATEPDFFVKQGDFQNLAGGRPMLYYREPAKALADWERGWRDLFIGAFPNAVDAIDAALGFDPAEEDTADDDEGSGARTEQSGPDE
jgi:NADPH-dependent glutamate synthase beta subunit-like oxidoreductase